MLRSDDAWVVAVVESPESCGVPCDGMRGVVAAAARAGAPTLQMAFLYPFDMVLDTDTGDMVAAHALFNITSAS